jgi:hypothetical protein
MNIVDILIILGCLAAGYWIVNSVIGKGIDTGDAQRGAEQRRGKEAKPALQLPAPQQPARPTGTVRALGTHPWHVELDIPADASRKDIQAAMKRRLGQAETSGDTAGAERIRRAAEIGMQQSRR